MRCDSEIQRVKKKKKRYKSIFSKDLKVCFVWQLTLEIAALGDRSKKIRSSRSSSSPTQRGQ